MTRLVVRHLAAAALMLLVVAPVQAQTYADTTTHVRHSIIHSTTRRVRHTKAPTRTRRHTRRRGVATRNTSKTRVRVKRTAQPVDESNGVPSTRMADSVATKTVIHQTPPNDTATLRSRTTITTVGTAPIDLNTATRQELMTLPGIDAGLADRIIVMRPFRLIGDLTARGILTPAEYARVETHITVTPP